MTSNEDPLIHAIATADWTLRRLNQDWRHLTEQERRDMVRTSLENVGAAKTELARSDH